MTTERISSYSRDGLRFDVRDEGPVGGEVIVLLHGFPQLNSCWDGVLPALHDRGFRTLAPNQRGYSPDARPRGRRPYRLGELTEDVTALVDRVGGPVHLVGHDWGAAVAWATAATRPDRVRTLTSVSVPHPGAYLRSLTRGQARHSWYMAAFNLPALPEWLLTRRSLARRILRRAGMTEAMVERYRHDFGDGAALRGGLGWYRALPFGDRAVLRRHVIVPTTHVWSDRDRFLVGSGAELNARYVDAPYRLEILSGVSHWIPEQRPADLARIILDRVGGSGG